jgi:GGDEF domain-containing protein
LLPESDAIGRLGADEFVALLSGADEAATQEVTQRLTQLLDERNVDAQRGYRIRYSVGQIQYDAGGAVPWPSSLRRRRRDAQLQAGVEGARGVRRLSARLVRRRRTLHNRAFAVVRDGVPLSESLS